MYRKPNKYLVLFAVMALISLTAGIATAAPVTQNITYQGKLTNAAGSPLTGTYSVTFRLYNVSSGGATLSIDTHNVTAANGLFTTSIAVTNPAVVDGRALWLGIKVGSDPEMTPRQEIRPVPYALSLRPGAIIMGSGSSPPVLTLFSSDSGGTGLNTYMGASNSIGVNASTRGQRSHGVFSSTTGADSHSLVASSTGDFSGGLYASTTGYNSDSVIAYTTGPWSDGIFISASGPNSQGVRTFTYGNNSNGVNVSTSGFGSKGIFVGTNGQQAAAVHAVTNGIHSNAVVGETNADGPAAVAGLAHGTGSWGVYAVSDKSYGLYAQTGNADQKYGIYTPDYLYAKGTQVPAADVAEYMPISGDATPGTVLVIGPDGKLQHATKAYDTRVAGIVSTDPGVTLGTRERGNPGEQIIAVAGRVPCRVDATPAPIHAGDLLTTSDNPGYAMKAEPIEVGGRIFYPSGIVLGKALGTLESGTGMIEVLVTLQ